MDDSDLDFVDFRSKFLKRVRKKPIESAGRKDKRTNRNIRQPSEGDEKTGSKKQHEEQKSKFVATQPVTVGDECGRDAGHSAASGDYSSQNEMRAKDKVLLKMQQFKRACPQKMAQDDIIPSTNHAKSNQASEHQGQDAPSLLRSDFVPFSLSTDEALALRLQRELDREAAGTQPADLEDRGLFFCQICQRDLSHMTPEGRTQHLNRCLDESEQSGPAPPAPSSVPDCPICGKKFKSQKSRSGHLKRCSSEMGVAPAVLLQVVQRQAQEETTATANPLLQTVGTKKKGGPRGDCTGRKKSKKKNEPLDEETMVALALSSSMQEQEKERQRQMEVERLSLTNANPSHNFMTPVLKWKPDAGKRRGNKRKAIVPPPLLLVQNAEAAMMRLQERVSALLLRGRPASPSTPNLNPSRLPGWTGAAPLWVKSAVLDGEFYVAELKDFFKPTEPTQPALSEKNDASEFLVPPEDEDTPASGTRTSILPFDSQRNSSPSVPLTPDQALRDLEELAEDGMTLTQYGYTAKELRLSGFIREEPDNESEMCDSGFLLQPNHKALKDTDDRAVERSETAAAEKRSSQRQAALTRLTSDLSSMVNNPQMSDVQLQVDGGEVYFAHSFMLYARCPLLAEMVHESGFGVQEDDVPAAQRVLLNDVPGEAVLAMLRYFYTAQCCFSASLQPHMLELASRFDLRELEQLCRFRDDDAADSGDGDASGETIEPSSQTDEAFVELLRSMWNEEDDRADADAGGDENDQAEKDGEGEESASREINEEELEEIYEFAATQRKREERDSEEEKDSEGDEVFTKLEEPKRTSSGKNLNPDFQTEPNAREDCSYSRLFSQSWGTYEDSPSYIPQTPPSASINSAFKTFAHIPPPAVTNLPVIGASPSLADDGGQEAAKRQSPARPASPAKQEPELIVLSDSSDESEVLNPPERNKESNSLTSSPDDCSPEVSWLVPSTPVQPKRSAGSTETKSSRTKLFSAEASSLSSAPSQNKLAARDTVSTSFPNGKHLGSSDSNPDVSPEKMNPTRTNPSDLSSLASQPSSKPDNPYQLSPRPHSSTPLHTDAQDSLGRKRKASEETELGSPQLSPLSSHSHSGRRDSKRHKKSGSGGEEAEQRKTTEESDVGETSFGFMDMDEPPIAFNDSWGLDGCAEANSERFSLRLDESPKHTETAFDQPSDRASGSLQPHSASTPTLTDDCLVWDSWDDDEEEDPLPLSQRVKPSASHQTPVARSKKRQCLMPITPMPHYSDMDTPELKNKLNRFGVRPLPKRQMILKLKEIHDYTHQLTSSDSEEEEAAAPVKPAPSQKFKAPRAPVSPVKSEDKQQLSASQSSHNSQTATSEESERSNPEAVASSDGDSDSDGGISSTQAASRLQDRLQAVRAFILSDSKLYNQILQYQPLVLSQLQQQLKAAGIRLGAAKLVDYLDSQCITFTAAKPGQPTRSRRRVKKPAKTAAAKSRKKATAAKETNI